MAVFILISPLNTKKNRMRPVNQRFLYKALRPYKHSVIIVRSLLSSLVSFAVFGGARPCFCYPTHLIFMATDNTNDHRQMKSDNYFNSKSEITG